MRLLLDTHIALWAITDSPRLSQEARSLIESPDNEIWISAVSIWEIAIKHSLKRESMPVSGSEALHWFRVSGYRELAITAHHATGIGYLPPLHTDPFDRLLVAQALEEPFRLLTHDSVLKNYSDSIIVV